VKAPQENLRQFVHVAMVGFAFLLRALTWPQAALMAAAALVFNLVLLPRVAPGIIRAADARGHRAGTLFYPLSVLLLILVFRSRLDIVAAAWAIMACGDGAATLAGTHLGGPRLPWNAQKTWSGLLAFVAAASAGAVALSLWVAPSIVPAPPAGFTWWAPVIAAIVAAFVETIPIGLDDNLSVPVAAGLALALAAVVDPDAVDWPLLASRLPWAVGLNAVMAMAAWARGSLTLTGAAAGTVLGIAIYLGAGPAGWAMLVLAFAAAVVSSRVGLARKAALGIAEERGGRRGAGNAIANCLVGAIGAWLMAVGWSDAPGALVLGAGLVAGASDTVASEIGKAFGGTPRAFPTLAAVPPGTPGAVSAVGTLAGLGAAVVMSLIAGLILPGGFFLTPFMVLGATAGAFAESALATRYEARGILNNDMLNFLNTVVAALAAAGGALLALQFTA
jgi:uncharacterized protein (TIGR00297 family)